MPKKGTGLAGELGMTRREDTAAYAREYRKRNKERLNAYARDYHNKRKDDGSDYLQRKRSYSVVARRKAKYNITRDCYDTMLTAQGGKCIICDEHYGSDLRVDHDHETNEIRGLLCSNCNSGLGLFKENANRMQRAIEYLDRYRGQKRK